MTYISGKMDLDEFREKILKIDENILKLIKQRLLLMPGIADYKLKNNLPIRDNDREKQLILAIKQKAVSLDISPELAEKIFRELINESCRIQENIKNEN